MTSLDRVRDYLTLEQDKEYQYPVNYAYDYLHGGIRYLRRPQLKLNQQLQSMDFLKLCASKCRERERSIERSDNAIDISPTPAGIPWACGIMACRQSKHWRLSLDSIGKTLHIVANDPLAKVAIKGGKSIAEIARHELALNFEEGWAKFPSYLFAEADEKRTEILAVLMVFIFVFDDFWEMHDFTSFSHIQDNFLARLRPGFSPGQNPTSTLQSFIDTVVSQIHELDRENEACSGKEMLDMMLRFFDRPPPPQTYTSVEEFLAYRREDAAVLYILACVKFSLNLSFDMNNPNLAAYIRLLKDHVSVANDLGSWEKEKKAYDSGKVLYLINTVDVIKRLFSLPTLDAALAIAQSFQFQTECEIDDEIQRLLFCGCLTADELQFIDASLYLMSGNVLVSTIMSRYGGESSRLR